MCENAAKTVGSVLKAAEPDLRDILTITGVAGTPQAAAALQAYDQAETDLLNWTQGDAPEEAIQILTDAQAAVSALTPLIPTTDALLINVVLAAIIVAIGIVTGNSPAPAAVHEGVTPEMVQADHERATMVDYTDRVRTLVPFYKVETRATWLPGRSPADQINKAWKQACTLTNHPEFIRA
jgi:hypothetical protein